MKIKKTKAEDPLALAAKLISIPSYVVGKDNEEEISDYIYGYLKQFGYFQVKKQKVEDGRFNIIATDGYPEKLAFFCHMDTVPPSPKWKSNPFKPVVKKGKLYGLGASDMKGGIASLLSALPRTGRTKGLYLVFDVDEEYYFKGIDKFVESNRVNPAIAVFPEPGFLIYNGHRGVIEIEITVGGTTAHSSTPDKGKNAVLGTLQTIKEIESQLRRFSDRGLGVTTVNLAAINGGTMASKGKRGYQIIQRANKVPDIAKALLEFRTSSERFDAAEAIRILRKCLDEQGVRLMKTDIKIDRKPFFVRRSNLKRFRAVVSKAVGTVGYGDIKTMGYGEGAIVNKAFGTDCVYLGPGLLSMAHKDNECILVRDLYKAHTCYKSLISTYCSD